MNKNLEVNRDVLIKYMEIKGWTPRQTAFKMNIDPSYFTRVLNGERKPGGKFIAGALRVFSGLTFEDMFYYVDMVSKDTKKSHEKNVV